MSRDVRWDEPPLPFEKHITDVLRQTRKTLARDFRRYWPSQSWQAPEATLVSHLGSALIQDAWHVYTEVPDGFPGSRKRLDLLALSGGVDTPDGTALLVEAKQIQGAAKAGSAARDLRSMSLEYLPQHPHNEFSPLPTGPAYALLVAMTTLPEPEAWWRRDARPRGSADGWKLLSQELSKSTIVGHVHLYRENGVPEPDNGWAPNHLLWAIRPIDNPNRDTPPRETP